MASSFVYELPVTVMQVEEEIEEWLRSWSRADKLGVIIAVTGIVVAVVTIAAFILAH